MYSSSIPAGGYERRARAQRERWQTSNNIASEVGVYQVPTYIRSRHRFRADEKQLSTDGMKSRQGRYQGEGPGARALNLGPILH